MSSRRAVRALAFAAITGLGITALAAPAHANVTLIVTFETGQNPDLPQNWSISQNTAYGSGFTFDNDAGYDVYLQTGAAGIISLGAANCTQSTGADACPINNGATGSFTIDSGVPETQIEVRYNGNVMLTFTVASSAPTDSTDSPTGSPGSHIQQFGVPATGTCDEAAPEGLNWGGAANGGWGESWAQWANEGNGGDVCTRTLGYNNSTGTWQVQ